MPGKVFKARVSMVWDDIQEGQILPTAHMISVSKFAPPGRFPVQFGLLDDISAYDIPHERLRDHSVFDTPGVSW
jgi:hypothetical protein